MSKNKKDILQEKWRKMLHYTHVNERRIFTFWVNKDEYSTGSTLQESTALIKITNWSPAI